MTQKPGPTQAIAAFVAETSLANVSAAVLKNAKTAVLDTLGVALAAVDQSIGRIVSEYVQSLGGDPVATVLGAGFRTSAPLAALANGTLAHALDYDDRRHVSTHTLPTALAIGEMQHASGGRMLEAYIIGREVGMRLTEAVEARRKEHGGPTFRGWYRVGVVGPIAAAATAARLLNLDSGAIATAIGIAASSAGGLRRNQGTMTKALHAGNAAMDGVQAALLAQRGFSGDQEILEAPLGFFTALCLPGEADLEPLTDRLGKPFDLEEATEIKPFPACSPSHKPLQGLLALHSADPFDPGEVEAIEVDLHTFSLFRLDPQEAVATGFSLPYLLAVALVDGAVGIDQVGEGRLHDPQVRSLMARVKHNPASAPENGPERVTVRLRGGRSLEVQVPRVHNLVTTEDIEAKYRDCAGRVLGPAEVERLHTLVMRLDRLADIRKLTAVAGGSA